MGYLVSKRMTYYAVFSINRKKKWIRIGRVDEKEARRVLKQLELEHLKGRLELKAEGGASAPVVLGGAILLSSEPIYLLYKFRHI